MSARARRSITFSASAIALVLLGGCGTPATSGTGSDLLKGAPEGPGGGSTSSGGPQGTGGAPQNGNGGAPSGSQSTGSGSGGAASGSLPAGTMLTATADVNLRTGPSTSSSILHVIPKGSTVTLVAPAEQNGFYNVKHNGSVGWAFATYFQAQQAPQDGGSSTTRDEAIARAKSGVGFSYWWGHGRYRPEGPTNGNAGQCSGSCPGCTHTGSYGGDCSGYVAKVWQIPASNVDLTVDDHPYSTSGFVTDTSEWTTISRDSVLPADAMVYNANGAGHVFVYASGDGWGSMYAYECKGCVAGCVYDLRTASNAYHAIRRGGW